MPSAAASGPPLFFAASPRQAIPAPPCKHRMPEALCPKQKRLFRHAVKSRADVFTIPTTGKTHARSTLPARRGSARYAAQEKRISLPRNHGRAPPLCCRFRHEKPVSLLLPQPCAFSFSGQHFLRMACEVCRLTAASTGQKAAYSGFTPSPPGFSGTVLPCGTRQTRMSGKRAFPFPQAPFLVPPPVSPKKPAPFRSFAGTQHTLARPERTHRMRFPSPKPRKSAFPRRSLPP